MHMKRPNKSVVPKICVTVGVCLLLVGVLTLISWQWTIYSSMEKMQTDLQTIRTLIPEPQGAALEEHRDYAMPVLSVEGTDFIGILEMPQYESALPVCADWGKITKHPCKLAGSIYDRSMQIGATTQKGQYDFYREISVGDAVLFTDAQGNRYTYTVKKLQYEECADQTALHREDAALTLLIKNIYGFEYLIVSCDISNS